MFLFKSCGDSIDVVLGFSLIALAILMSIIYIDAWNNLKDDEERGEKWWQLTISIAVLVIVSFYLMYQGYLAFYA
jgi:uncharacterized membrane protein YidH (DUF202 family)